MPLVGLGRYQVDIGIFKAEDVAFVIATPAYVMLVTGYAVLTTWTNRSVEVELTVFENVTELAAEHWVYSAVLSAPVSMVGAVVVAVGIAVKPCSATSMRLPNASDQYSFTLPF